jgi:integrase
MLLRTLFLSSEVVSYKTQLVNSYSRYARYFGISWTKPKYRTEEYLFKLPTEERIDSVIANCRLKHALEFTLMKERGFRPIELHRTRLEDFDLDKRVLHIGGAKNGRGRTVQLKQSTHVMPKTSIHKHNIAFDDE